MNMQVAFVIRVDTSSTESIIVWMHLDRKFHLYCQLVRHPCIHVAYQVVQIGCLLTKAWFLQYVLAYMYDAPQAMATYVLTFLNA